jgi:hypothetical protein
VANEVVIEVDGSPSQVQVDALAKRHGLNRVESQRIELTGTTMFRWRIPPGRSVRDVVRSLEADSAIRSAQPNYIYSLQQSESVQRAAIERPGPAVGDTAQYAAAKLQLLKAHNVVRGTGVRVAIIDSGVDKLHPELAGVIADTFDALGTDEKPHAHGTAIAGHGRRAERPDFCSVRIRRDQRWCAGHDVPDSQEPRMGGRAEGARDQPEFRRPVRSGY